MSHVPAMKTVGFANIEAIRPDRLVEMIRELQRKLCNGQASPQGVCVRLGSGYMVIRDDQIIFGEPE